MSETTAAPIAVQTAPRLTEALARFVCEIDYGALPARVVDRIKVYTLDCLACGFVGAVQPWSGMVRRLVEESGGSAEASGFLTKRWTTMAQAALLNGVMIGGFESEHIGHNAHPAGTVFPAAFAVAEAGHKSGKEFIAAMAAGYEVVCRIGDAQTGAVEIERGFHNPSVNGPYGAHHSIRSVEDTRTAERRMYPYSESIEWGSATHTDCARSKAASCTFRACPSTPDPVTRKRWHSASDTSRI